MTGRRYWQMKHCWSVLRLRRKVAVGSTVATVVLCVGWTIFAPWTYKATAVVSFSGMCPHGIVAGEPYIGMMGLGDTNRYITKVVCTPCREKAVNSE
jgi:hypothetical protein